jgi:hypothetical protein
MLRVTTIVAVCALVSSAMAGDQRQPQSSQNQDQAVIAVALENFAKWKKATFGEFKGVLAVEAKTLAKPDTSAEEVFLLAPNIRTKFELQLAAAFAERNHDATDALPLFQGSQWAQTYVRPTGDPPRWQLPPAGVKAVGQLTLPGYSPDGAKALVQLHHSWSVHSAVVTYILVKDGSGWRVAARDQSVAL